MNLQEHLKQRHLDVDRYNGIMFMGDVIIFPLWNLSGQFVGYQQYRPGASKERRNDPRDGRYYTSLHGDKNEKPLAVWGLESLTYDRRYVVIVEGIFDACQLHNMDVPCVALLTSSHKHCRNWLTSLSRKVYKVEDDHGSKLGPYEQLKIPEGRNDLGDCLEDEIGEMLCKQLPGRYLNMEMITWRMAREMRRSVDESILGDLTALAQETGQYDGF